MLSLSIQDACDYAMSRLVEQIERSVCSETGTCLYSNGKGARCAVGWLLTEEELEKVGQEEMVVSFLLSAASGYDIKTDYSEEDIRILTTLQHLHDAETKEGREDYIEVLESEGIDVSAEQYQAWADLA